MGVVENLVELGKRLKGSEQMQEKIQAAGYKNPWFVPAFTQYALDAIVSDMLDEAQLKKWLDQYDLHVVNKTVALIFAGNIPLVGFHDFLCCYVSGCKMMIKLSSKDDELFLTVLDILKQVDPSVADRVEIVERIKDFDAVIATGSDNTNRYFEYYFRNHPKILRKSRNSVAVLDGSESAEELERLADDIFLYFGFGCRNVSKIYVPKDYTFLDFFPALHKYSWLHGHSKFMNNYDYNRTILLMNKAQHLANEFLMIVENTSIASPIGTLYFEYWHDENVLTTAIKQQQEKIQCVVTGQTRKLNFEQQVAFGQSQHPALDDYADGIDTMKFLLQL